MLEGIWKKGSPLTQLVGMYIDTSIMENYVEISVKS